MQNGIADMPMSDLAKETLHRRLDATPGSESLFPSPRVNAKKPYITTFKTAWTSTLEQAGVPHFSLYELRHTFATRLSAGGVADHLRDPDATAGRLGCVQAL
jgi:integrase